MLSSLDLGMQYRWGILAPVSLCKASPCTLCLYLRREAALLVCLQSVLLSYLKTANHSINHLLSRSLMEKYLFKIIGQKEQLFYKQGMAATSQSPRLDFPFLQRPQKREGAGEKEGWAVYMSAGGITKIHSDVATGSS